MPSGLFYLNSLDRSISYIKGAWSLLSCFVEISEINANSEDPDQTPYSAASDLDLHCLPVSIFWDARLKWVKDRPGINNDRTNATYNTTDAQTRRTATEEPPWNGHSSLSLTPMQFQITDIYSAQKGASLSSVKDYSRNMHTYKHAYTMMKQSKELNGELKLEHKKITNRTSMGPTKDINRQTPTI